MLKALELPKFSKKSTFQKPEASSKQKNISRDNHSQKNLRQTLVFMWNSALREKFNFYFSGVFC